MKFLIGADPELFVFNKETNSFVSAHGMVEGTKNNPFPVNNGAIQVDGMALEFNILPSSSMEEFVSNIEIVKQQLQEHIGPKYEMKALPSIRFSEEEWTKAPKEAKELGCTPDYNAWEGGSVNIIDEEEGSTLRTGAGHVHIGWIEDVDPRSLSHVEDCIAFTKQLDASLGVISNLWDQDKDRSILYGKPGAFRPKPYGVEYRTLSNAWVGNTSLTGFVYKAVIKAGEDLLKGKKYWEMFDEDFIISSIKDKSVEAVDIIYSTLYDFPKVA